MLVVLVVCRCCCRRRSGSGRVVVMRVELVIMLGVLVSVVSCVILMMVAVLLLLLSLRQLLLLLWVRLIGVAVSWGVLLLMMIGVQMVRMLLVARGLLGCDGRRIELLPGGLAHRAIQVVGRLASGCGLLLLMLRVVMVALVQ